MIRQRYSLAGWFHCRQRWERWQSRGRDYWGLCLWACINVCRLTYVPYMGPSIKYVTQFLANFYLPSPCHTSSHIPGPPIFRRPRTKNRDKSPLVQILSQLFGGFFVRRFCQRGLLSGRFCPGWFWSIPPSVRIHLLQQKVKHHFKFHVSYVW